MKKETHPEWYPEAKVIYEGEVVMTVGATQPEIRVDVWSQTHPFYTGQSRLLDTEGQVDRFYRRLNRLKEIQAEREQEVEEQSDPTRLAVEAFELDKRSENALLAADLTTVGDVLEKLEEGEDALLAIPSIGRKALIDIKRFLRAEGLIE